MELAINPSKIISSLCYSVLRLEPYTNCSYGCEYCYARWYRSGALKPRAKAIGMFAKVAKKLDTRLAFRLATLSDPLQDIEEDAKVSLKLMRIAAENEIPIILCTKSDRIAKQPWKGVVESMAKDELAVVQVSISSFNPQLEPRASHPVKRLEALATIDAPRILRLQPLLPNYSFSDVHEFVDAVADYDIDQITVEMLRIERSEIQRYSKFWQRWTEYSFEGELIKADAPEVLEELSDACRKRGIDFGLCKEGLFHLETANCCGMHYLNAELRPTLREIYRALVKRRKIRLDDIPNVLSDHLFGEKLQSLPRPIRKALRFHEKVLLKVLHGDVEKLTPLVKVGDGYVELNET